MACQARGAADPAVPDQDLGQEDGAEKYEEGFYAVRF